jgi:hypothetical protein
LRNSDGEHFWTVHIITVNYVSFRDRRYKVRSSIAMKQQKSSSLGIGDAVLGGQESGSYSSPGQIPAEAQEELNKWKTAYEKVVRENEQLRTRGGDALVLQQWKQRYEECLQQKEELQEKVNIYARMNVSSPNGVSAIGGNSASLSGRLNGIDTSRHPTEHVKPIEQQLIDLKDEYKV